MKDYFHKKDIDMVQMHAGYNTIPAMTFPDICALSYTMLLYVPENHFPISRDHSIQLEVDDFRQAQMMLSQDDSFFDSFFTIQRAQGGPSDNESGLQHLRKAGHGSTPPLISRSINEF